METKALAPDLRTARRRLLLGSAGIAVSSAGFGLVYGLAARQAGYTPIEAVFASVVTFAGASQFAALGAIAAGMPWAGILIVTALLNARHLLYGASLAPHLRGVGRAQRAAMAHVLCDESFALSAAHFTAVGRTDVPGYWMAALVGVFIPWPIGTAVGALAGGAIVDPARLGLDAVFPAAMAGLAVGLIVGRREFVAASAGTAIGVTAALALGPGPGIVAGGLIGPLVALAVPDRRARRVVESEMAGVAVDVDGAVRELAGLAEPATGWRT